jgi:putative aldouronate transport system permease protein
MALDHFNKEGDEPLKADLVVSPNAPRKKKREELPLKKKKGFLHELITNRIMFLMLLPAIVFFLVNSYIPMVGIYYAFVRFDFNTSLFNSQFVGLENFKFLWKSGALGRLTLNTFGYNLAFIVIGNMLAITCAILVSELRIKWLKKLTQSIMFLPYFISFVILSVIVYNMFNYETGFLNTMLKAFHLEPVDMYSKPIVWVFLIIIFYLWKNLGYSMVIYLAAITGISEEYYEAAKIDGANIFQRIWFITLPMLKSTFVMLLLFALGSIMKGQFDLFYQLVGNNGLLYNTTDILDTYVYRSLKVTFEMGMATAAGVYQSVFGFVLIMTVNYIIRKVNDEYALF